MPPSPSVFSLHLLRRPESAGNSVFPNLLQTCLLGLLLMETEVREVEEEEVSCPRNFLQRFAGGSRLDDRPAISGRDDDVELSLGLSLGGLFGSDPLKEKKLVRSSSIAAMIPRREHEFMHAGGGLARSCSLPTAAEEERRKRKELQSLKRLEAKRKRLEKRSLRLSSSDEAAAGKCGGRVRGAAALFGSTRGVAVAAGLPRWASPVALRSTGLPRCSSLSKSAALESRPMQGFEFSESSKQRLDSMKSLDSSRDEMDISAVRSEESPGEREKFVTDGMPRVSTTGDGPNGRRIEGFLFRYGKGEEVRIVCVCHGKFLTPAEFVKHAGGGDVVHPLRHIVMNPSPSTFS